MISKFLYSLCLLYLISLPYVSAQDSLLDLRSCVAMAIRNNALLQQNQLQVERANMEYKQARANRLPAINADLSHSFSQGRGIDPTTNQFVDENNSFGSQGLNAQWQVFNGFRILHDVRMKAHAKTAGKLEFEGQENDLRLQVIESYVQVLTAKDMVEQAQRQLAVTTEQLRRADVMFKEGAFPPGDYYDIKGQFKTDENAILTQQQQLFANRTRLAALLQLSVTQLGELAPLAQPLMTAVVDGEALFEKAKTALPTYQALDWRIKEATQQIKVAQANYYPSLAVHAGLSSRYSSSNTANYFDQAKNNLGKSLGFTLNIPIFNQFQTRNQVLRAKLSLEESQLQKDIALNTLRETTARTVFDMAAAGESVRNLQEQEQNYAEAFRIAQVQFDEGASNSVLYLTAKNKLDAARNQLLMKKYQYLLQKFMNDFYAGTLDL